MAQTTSLVFNGGVIPSPSPAPSGNGKAKLLKIGEITVTEHEVQVTKNVICDPDSVTTVAPFMEVLTSARLAELISANNILVLDDGTMQYLMSDANIAVEDGTAVCTAVNFLGLSKENRAKVLYPCTRLIDELTLQQVIEVGEPVETGFDLVKAYPEDTEGGTLIDKLEIEDTIDDDRDPLLEIHPTDGKVAINEDNLRDTIDGLGADLDSVVETIDGLDFDSVQHAYLHSTLNQSAGDSVTTGTQINVFALTADLVGDCFEFEQTTTIDDTPFGYVWIEPGTYLINASVTLQWVGNPRGTFVAKVGSVMGENFDFSQEQEIKRNTTRVVTIPNRMKLSVNITYDAGTPVMGFWIQSMQVVKLAGGMSQTNITHDSTLVGRGSVADPLGINLQAVKDYVTPEMFGASGDSVTDDSSAINAMFASGATRFCFAKDYQIKSYCYCSVQGAEIFGGGTIRRSSTDLRSILVTGKYSRVHDLHLVGAAISVCGSYITIENCTGTGLSFHAPFLIEAYNGHDSHNITIRNCIAFDSNSFGFAQDNRVNGSQPVDEAVVHDILFENCKAVNLDEGNDNSFKTGFAFITRLFNRYNIKFVNCVVDGVQESGYHFEDTSPLENVVFVNCVAMNCGRKPRPTYGAAFLANTDYGKPRFIGCSYKNCRCFYFDGKLKSFPTEIDAYSFDMHTNVKRVIAQTIGDVLFNGVSDLDIYVNVSLAEIRSFGYTLINDGSQFIGRAGAYRIADGIITTNTFTDDGVKTNCLGTKLIPISSSTPFTIDADCYVTDKTDGYAPTVEIALLNDKGSIIAKTLGSANTLVSDNTPAYEIVHTSIDSTDLLFTDIGETTYNKTMSDYHETAYMMVFFNFNAGRIHKSGWLPVVYNIAIRNRLS